MLTKQHKRFLQDTIKHFIHQYEEHVSNLGFFSFFKKSEYSSLVVRLKELLLKLDDNEDVLEKMSMGEVATLRDISLEILDNNKDMPDASIAIECITILSKELPEIEWL